MTENDLTIRFLANFIHVMINENHNTGHARDNRYFYINVDQTGYIELDVNARSDPSMTREERRKEAIDFLLDAELAEWRAIGPEDKELFVTRQFAEMLPDLATVGEGWKEWHSE